MCKHRTIHSESLRELERPEVDQTTDDYETRSNMVEMCQRELQIDGSLSERTLEPTAGLLAISPLLALCNEDVSLHGASCLTAAPLVPLYPESGLLLESACVDFDGAGSTGRSTGSVTCSSVAAGQAISSGGTGSEDAVVASGTDVGRHGSLAVTLSRWCRLRSAVRRLAFSVPMQCLW